MNAQVNFNLSASTYTDSEDVIELGDASFSTPKSVLKKRPLDADSNNSVPMIRKIPKVQFPSSPKPTVTLDTLSQQLMVVASLINKFESRLSKTEAQNRRILAEVKTQNELLAKIEEGLPYVEEDEASEDSSISDSEEDK